MAQPVTLCRRERALPPRTFHETLRTFRRLGVRAALRGYWLARRPRVLLTSVPKCGTHLLRRLLEVVALPSQREVEWNITPQALGVALGERRGNAVVGHVLPRSEITRFVEANRVKVLFITRDPRDQVVSHLYHFRADANHPLHPYFRDELTDDDAALLAVIRGVKVSEAASVAPVDELYGALCGWRKHPMAYATSFERLVGPRGGGSEDDQRREVAAILRHIGFPLHSLAAVRAVASRVFSPAAPTFRVGRIGGWREHFKPCHIEAFKEVAGQLLIELGYEKDLNW